LAISIASLSYSIWIMSHQATPTGFVARNGIIFLGIAMFAWATANLLAPASRFKIWLTVLWWAGLVLAIVSTYLRTH
jgi:hypothetical protein